MAGSRSRECGHGVSPRLQGKELLRRQHLLLVDLDDAQHVAFDDPRLVIGVSNEGMLIDDVRVCLAICWRQFMELQIAQFLSAVRDETGLPLTSSSQPTSSAIQHPWPARGLMTWLRYWMMKQVAESPPATLAPQRDRVVALSTARLVNHGVCPRLLRRDLWRCGDSP